MSEISIAQVEFIWDGEFCDDDCQWLNYDKTHCVLWSKDVKEASLGPDPLAEYQEKGKASEFSGRIRCKLCKEAQAPMGIHRKTPKGVRVFPTPDDIVEGRWVPAEELLDFRGVLKGWFIQAQACWQVLEEDEVKMISVAYQARKGKKGKTRDLGTAFELKNLDELPKDARLPFMLWANSLYEDAVDIDDSLVFAKWYEAHGDE